ncbi:MAG: GntR family transcriptional regulator [Pseudomonadota bacterium]
MSRPLSAAIADRLSTQITEGELTSGDRLPSETDLADQFDCSRGTVREALKRLAARNLIRTKRGAGGGAYVNKLTFDAAVDAHVATSTLLLSMNAVDFETAAEARFALEAACTDLACANHDQTDLTALKAAHDRLSAPCDDEAFCAADVAFHRAFVDAAHNPILSYQLAGAVEAMQPLMNVLTYAERDRAEILALYTHLANALRARDPAEIRHVLRQLQALTINLFHRAAARRANR